MSLNPIRPINTPQSITVAGYTYTIPTAISAGVRARVTDEQMQIFLAEHELSKMTRQERHEFNESLSDNFAMWAISHSVKVVPAILRTLLKPVDNAPSVDEMYELATGKEVDFIVNFFNGSALDKTLLLNDTEESLEQPSPDGTE